MSCLSAKIDTGCLKKIIPYNVRAIRSEPDP